MAKNSPGGRRKSDEDVFVEHVAALTHGDKNLLNAYLKGYQEGTEHYRTMGRAIMDAAELANRVAEEDFKAGCAAGVADRARLDAVLELSRLNLPVGEPEDLERESVPYPDDLLP
jgi:hypothetical protein